MMAFLIYDLKVALLIAVFYMFYRLLLSRETFHRVNRLVLLLTAMASFVLPLCVITLHRTVVVPRSAMGTVSLDALSMMVEEVPQTPLWQTLLIAVFLAGMAVALGYTLVSVCRVWLLISRSEQLPQADGTVICVTDDDLSPFSWMRYIVLSRSEYEAGNASVLAHERGHIRQHHSLDLLLVDTLTALQWFNPAMWMLRQDLRAIHEYEADAAVLSQGINMRQYQYLLIQKAVSRCGYSVANGISHSTLKNRIDMMLTNKKSNRMSWLKLLALLPIVGVTLAMNAETVNNYVYKDVQQQPQKKIVKKGKKAAQVKMNGQTVEVKEEKAIETKAKEEPKRTDLKIIFNDNNQDGKEPLIVIDGKASTKEELKALDQKKIDHVNVLKANEDNKDLRRVYGDKYNADTSNGIIFVITKEYAKSDERKKDYVVVVKSKDKEEAKKNRGVVDIESVTPEEPLDVVEQMPEFPGGMPEMMKYISTNVKYPAEAIKAGKQGRVLVQFIVEKDGSVNEAKIVKKVCDELDAEALRVVNAMPKWTPGKHKGKAVRVKYTIPISFRMN